MTSDYFYIHRELYTLKGKASDRICVDCGEKACDWSHIHNTDPLDVNNYESRCRSCHLKYDYTDDRRLKVALANKSMTIDYSLKSYDPKFQGENNGHSKLTENDVREIRKIYEDGNTTIASLARKYRMSESGVRDLIKRKTWSHVK